VIHCNSDVGFLNYGTKAFLITSNVAFNLLTEYFIYHVSALYLSNVMSRAFFTSSLLIYLATHTTSTTNQNWSRSSVPSPLKTGSLMSSAILLLLGGLGGGGGVGEVWGGGWGVRVVEGLGIPKMP